MNYAELPKVRKMELIRNRKYCGYISHILEMSNSYTTDIKTIRYSALNLMISPKTITKQDVKREYPIIDAIVKTMERKGYVKTNNYIVTLTEKGKQSYDDFKAINMVEKATRNRHFRNELSMLLFFSDRYYRLSKRKDVLAYLSSYLKGEQKENMKLLEEAIDFLIEQQFLVGTKEQEKYEWNWDRLDKYENYIELLDEFVEDEFVEIK